MNQNLDAYGEYTTPNELRLVRTLPAPIERVWEYLTDPEKRGTWLASGPMDLRVGGRVKLHFDHSRLSPTEVAPERGNCAGGDKFDGEVTQCEPPHLLSFTWGAGDVTFELAPQAGATRMVITHRRLKAPEESIGVGAGWHTHVAYLIARLTGQEPPLFWATHRRLQEEYAARLPVAA
jgi:uncharacterized protein YndB with AHSA1/START domain